MRKINAIEKKSRALFHKLHTVQNNDDKIFGRLVALLSTKYLKVPSTFFKGKVCLDAGCGNGNATYAMLKAGAKHVYAFDLDKTVYAAEKRLKIFAPRYTLAPGNVLSIDFPDNFFDFTHCAGVLHHTVNPHKGLAELARVTKPGGILNFDVYGKGGLFRDITGLLREKYRTDKKFHSFVDGLNASTLATLWNWTIGEMHRHGDISGVSKALGRKLFDEDLVLTIKDRIQSPLYHESTEVELRKWLKKNGFTNIVRLKRYPKMYNIRRFLAPTYNEYDHPFARLLSGEGYIQLKATKK